jgi:hypothetical protein
MSFGATEANDPDEERSLHHRPWFGGFGPVQNPEEVMFAVFDGTPIEGTSLQANSFESKRLKNRAQSLTRTLCVTKTEFSRRIVRARRLQGVATAPAAHLRALTADINIQGRWKKVPAVCLLDRVDRGEPDGHATMGFTSHTTEDVGQKQLKLIRDKIMLDVADVFSPIESSDSHPWPSFLSTLWRRVRWMLWSAGPTG